MTPPLSLVLIGGDNGYNCVKLDKYSPTHSLTHSFIHSLTPSLVVIGGGNGYYCVKLDNTIHVNTNLIKEGNCIMKRSYIHALIHSLTHSLTHS